MGAEDWLLKSTKLITDIKKKGLKIWSRGQTLKNTILKKKITKIIKNIYEICFKNRVFFGQVIKMKIKGVIEELKFKKCKK